MNWLRNFIKEQIFKDERFTNVARDAYIARTRMEALEDYLDIRYFHGDKCKAHYRKRKTIKRPVGRPKKK